MKSRRPLIWLGLAVSVAAVAFGLVAFLGPRDTVEPNVDGGNYGWAGPKAVEAAKPIVEKLRPFRIFGDDQVSHAAGPVNVRLWHAAKQIGISVPNIKQERGDCVSWGYRNAVAYLQAVGIATGTIRGPPASWHDPFPPYIYGTSRVFIGGGKISGDGSVGAWAQDAVKRFGVLAADAPGVPPYSGAIAGRWGDRPGPPREFVDLASEFRVETTALVESAEDVAAAIRNGYPVPICSNFGTRSFRRVDGRVVAVGDASWGHCMCLLAYDETAPSRERYFYCLNSWGEDAHPRPLGDEPAGGFWLTWQQVDRIARQGDSFALSNFSGFPARRIDFRILAQHSGAAKEGGNHAKFNDARRPIVPSRSVPGGDLRRDNPRRGQLEQPGRRLPPSDVVERRGADHPGRGSGFPAVLSAARSSGAPGVRRSTLGTGDNASGAADGLAGRAAAFAVGLGTELSRELADAAAEFRRAIGLGGLEQLGDEGRLLALVSGTTISDRDGRVPALSDPDLHRSALRGAVQDAGSPISRVRQKRLADRRAADLAPADRSGRREGDAGSEVALLEVPGRIDPYPDPYFSGPGGRPASGLEGFDGWVRPADLERLDAERSVGVDARERRGDSTLFGPSAGELRDLADRLADRTVGEAERRIAARARDVASDAAVCGLVGCGCIGASCGCVLLVAKIFAIIVSAIIGAIRKPTTQARRGQ